MAVGQDSGYGTSGEGGTSAGTSFPDMRHPGGNGGGEGFRVRDTRMEMAALKDSGCETTGWKWRH